jgi:hypothetical protein
MQTTTSQETFFRPIEISRKTWTMPADSYNRTRSLFKHTQSKNVFVPIRTMQFLAIIDKNEIVFIDGTGGYMHQDNQGGRIIQLSWRDFRPGARESILEPVPCTIVYYLERAEQTMKRLYREFSDALVYLEQRAIESHLPQKTARILTIRAGD